MTTAVFSCHHLLWLCTHQKQVGVSPWEQQASLSTIRCQLKVQSQPTIFHLFLFLAKQPQTVRQLLRLITPWIYSSGLWSQASLPLSEVFFSSYNKLQANPSTSAMETTPMPDNHATENTFTGSSSSSPPVPPSPSRYEAQKRRDWNTFSQYLRNHRPPLPLPRCSGAHVLEFLSYLDQFGKTKVHIPTCPFYGHPNPPAPCPCPLRQAWGSLDALIGRLRAAFEENGGRPESNPFGARAVRLYLREVREMQSKARGISYDKKKRRKQPPPQQQQP